MELSEYGAEGERPRSMFDELKARSNSPDLGGVVDHFLQHPDLYQRGVPLVYTDVLPHTEGTYTGIQAICWVCLDHAPNGQVRLFFENIPPQGVGKRQFAELCRDMPAHLEAGQLQLDAAALLTKAAEQYQLILGISIIGENDRVLPIFHIPEFFYGEAYDLLTQRTSFMESYQGSLDRESFAAAVSSSLFYSFMQGYIEYLPTE